MIDKFTYQGVEYKAVDSAPHGWCNGCAFQPDADSGSFNSGCDSSERPRCTIRLRADGRDIIWVKQDD